MNNIPVTMIFSFSVLFAQNTVKDFAPLKIGNVWEYAYTDSLIRKLGVGPPYNAGTIEKSMILIEAKSFHVSGKDSVYLLQYERKGVKRVYDLTDTTIDSISLTGMDSVTITDSTIERGSGFQCPVFPVFSSHYVDTVSNLTRDKVVIGLDTLVRIFDTLYIINKSHYVQNFGLTYYRHADLTNTTKFSNTATLIAFNGNLIVSILPHSAVLRVKSKNLPGNGYHLTLGINQAKYPIISQGFLLNGISVSTDKIHAALPIITVKKSINPKF